MRTYKALVNVLGPSGKLTMSVWAQVSARNPFQARQLMEAQYGRGNVIGLPVPA